MIFLNWFLNLFPNSWMVKNRVLPGSVIWTDEGNSFNDLVDLKGYRYSHATVCHAGVIDKRNAVLRR